MNGPLRLRLDDGTWEDRYFVLDEAGDINCFFSEDSASADGVVSVRNITRVLFYPRHCGGRGFEILAQENEADRQSYLLLASSPEIAQEWMDAIRIACDKFQVQVSIANGTRFKSASNREQIQEPVLLWKTNIEAIRCLCYSPNGNSFFLDVLGGDYVQSVRERMFLQSGIKDHLCSEYTILLGGLAMYLDTRDGSKVRMSDNQVVLKAIQEKEQVVLRLVLDSRFGGDDDEFFDTKMEFEEASAIAQPGPEDFRKFSAPLLRRTYLHLHVKECWFKDSSFWFTDDLHFFNVVAGVYHGGQRLGTHLELSTGFVPRSLNPQWNECLTFPINLYDFPEVASLNLSVYSGFCDNENNVISELVGWTNFHCIRADGTLDTSEKFLRLWKDKPYYSCGAVPESEFEDYVGVLHVSMDGFIYPVNSKLKEVVDEDEGESLLSYDDSLLPTSEDEELLSAASNSLDIFRTPTEEDRLLLWRYRYSIKNKPRAAAKFLQSVPWHKYVYVKEARRVLSEWTALDPYTALQLLGPQFGDPVVRTHAVSQLFNIPADELCSLLLQLVHALQYEPRLESSLLVLLLEKASTDQRIGHFCFWHMKAGLDVPFFARKLNAALWRLRNSLSKSFLKDLVQQEDLVLKLNAATEEIRNVKGRRARTEHMNLLLSKLETFDHVSLPVDPSCKVSGLDVERCKFMDSKKVPLWLVFRKAGTGDEHIAVIFKCGDDLRQDMLVLQLFNLMNKCWSQAGLNVEMTTYSCVATAGNSGMLQIVHNAETLSNICKTSGGAIAVFKEDTLLNWITAQAPKGIDAVDNFVRSCAASSVGSCVLGIADRHNDNIMLKTTGELLHVDFGNIMGHFKLKFGVRRERVHFVFTPDMAYVMGGPKGGPHFKRYKNLCKQAFNTVRSQADSLLSLVSLMVSSGLEQISSPSDVHYMLSMLLLDKSDEDAWEQFNGWMNSSLHSKTTQINCAIHTLVHK